MKFISITKPALSLISLFSMLQAAAHADPSIVTYPSSLSHGQTVTIQGNSFQTKLQGPPLLWNPMDGESAYSGFTNGQALPKAIGPWPGTSGTAYFKTSNPRGKWTAKYSNSPNTSGYAPGAGQAAVGNKNWGSLCDQSHKGKFYVTWWTWMSFDSTQTSGSDKFFRLNIDDIMTWQPNQFITNWSAHPNDISAWVNWTTKGGKIGAWNRMEVLINNYPSSYPTGKPQAIMKVNQQTVFDITSGVWVSPYGDLSHPLPEDICAVGNIGFDASNGTDRQPIVDFGEFYIDNTFQRVEICDKNSKSTSTHCEIQIPQSWSTDGSQIIFKVNQGTFADGDIAYLYVIDDDGIASTGKQFTFVSTNGAPDTISTLTKKTVSPN